MADLTPDCWPQIVGKSTKNAKNDIFIWNWFLGFFGVADLESTISIEKFRGSRSWIQANRSMMVGINVGMDKNDVSSWNLSGLFGVPDVEYVDSIEKSHHLIGGFNIVDSGMVCKNDENEIIIWKSLSGLLIPKQQSA